MIYRLPPSLITGLAGVDLAAHEIPTEQEYVAAYCRRTGRSGIAGLDFYVAFNMFRLAAIIHGVKGRMLRGSASSTHARETAELLEPLAQLAWRQIKAA
jgi:aminoglycoside phosphotransferase (APT) family kinase protein